MFLGRVNWRHNFCSWKLCKLLEVAHPSYFNRRQLPQRLWYMHWLMIHWKLISSANWWFQFAFLHPPSSTFLHPRRSMNPCWNEFMRIFRTVASLMFPVMRNLCLVIFGPYQTSFGVMWQMRRLLCMNFIATFMISQFTSFFIVEIIRKYFREWSDQMKSKISAHKAYKLRPI